MYLIELGFSHQRTHCSSPACLLAVISDVSAVCLLDGVCFTCITPKSHLLPPQLTAVIVDDQTMETCRFHHNYTMHYTLPGALRLGCQRISSVTSLAMRAACVHLLVKLARTTALSSRTSPACLLTLIGDVIDGLVAFVPLASLQSHTSCPLNNIE